MTCRTSITRLREVWLARAGLGLAALALGACSGPVSEGPSRTETRNVGDFHSLNISGTADARISVGPATSLTITAGENILKNVSTKVQGGMLLVESQQGWWWNRGDVRLQITMPVLQEVVVGGAGKINVEGAVGEALQLSLNGAGSVVAKGEIQALTVNINGAGKADLANLRTRAAKVVVNGAGDLTVHATDKLDAVVNGVGKVRYVGSPPALVTKVNGVGRIEQMAPPGP
jgi:hypothetical protein